MPKILIENNQKNIENLAKKILVAGDASRLKILCVIFDNKRVCVSEIAKKLKMSVAIVSHHLKSLSKAGFLEPNRDGKQICYTLLSSKFNSDLKDFICRNRNVKI